MVQFASNAVAMITGMIIGMVVSLTPAFSQDATPVPTIEGTLHIMYLDGTTNSFTSERKFTSVEECMLSGNTAIIEILMLVPLQAMYMECVPAGDPA